MSTQDKSVRLPLRIVGRGLTAVSLGLVAGCADNEPQTSVDTLIHNVRVIDVVDGGVTANRSIVIDAGIILDVVSENARHRYVADHVIDGASNFVIPALGDVHVHLQSQAELENFVRYGVGLVVNMSGGRQHLDMRERVASHELLGPKIVTAGPTLDGDPPTNPLFTTVNPETVGEVVPWISNQGYDLVKIYQQMNVDTLSATIAAAGNQGLVVNGHVSRETGIDAALDAGQKYVAHGEELAFESFDEAARSYERGAVPVLADRLEQAGVTVTPMLAYLQNIPQQATDLLTYLSTDEMRAVPAAMRMSFDQRQGWYSNRDDPAGFAAQIDSLANFVATLAVALNERDVPLVLGTDAGFGGAIPGYSVHEELAALVDAGLTELSALQTATLRVGEYLDQIDPDGAPWGQIKPNHDASLVVLGANPLEDIAATRDIRGVMVGGRWLGESALAMLTTTLAERQRALLPLARAFEDALVAGQPEEARAIVESIPDAFAGDPLISADNCVFLGYRYYYGGDRPLAGRLYDVCVGMHPDSSALWIHIGRVRESEGETDAAIEAYRRARALNPWYGDPGAAIERLSAAPNN